MYQNNIQLKLSEIVLKSSKTHLRVKKPNFWIIENARAQKSTGILKLVAQRPQNIKNHIR